MQLFIHDTPKAEQQIKVCILCSRDLNMDIENLVCFNLYSSALLVVRVVFYFTFSL